MAPRVIAGVRWRPEPRTSGRFACTLSLVALGAAPGAWAQPPQEPAPTVEALSPLPTFPTGVEKVNVDVSVTRDGHPVSGLTAADFVVSDNGVVQQVDVVAGESLPIDVVLALDASASVRGKRLVELQRAAHAFVDALAPSDTVTLLAFNTHLALAAPAGASRAETHAAIDRVQGQGATSLVDAAHAALLLTDPRRGRPLALLFSDGVDQGSWLKPEAVEATARASDAVVDYVGIEGGVGFLDGVARATGGVGWSARQDTELAGAFATALEEFRSRYHLGYEPRGVRREGWHELKVRLRGRPGKIRARPGYEVRGAPLAD